MIPQVEVDLDLSAGWREPAPGGYPSHAELFPPTAEDGPARQDVTEVTSKPVVAAGEVAVSFDLANPAEMNLPTFRSMSDAEFRDFYERSFGRPYFGRPALHAWNRAVCELREERREARREDARGGWQPRQTRLEFRREDQEAIDTLAAEKAERTRLLSVIEPGDSVFSLPADPVIWGTPQAPVAVEGQGWMICGADGNGKTSDAGQYVKARIGIVSEVWGMPVAPLPEGRTAWYFAMDRPVQAKRAFARGLSPELHRDVLRQRLHWQAGPPRLSLATEQGRAWALEEAERLNAGLVVFDSRKDLGPTENGDHVFEVAVTVQTLVAAGVDVLILHHPNQARRNGPPSLEDVKGVRDVFSGLGSVVILDGKPGAELIEVHHVKPVYEPFRPFVLQRDHATGEAWPFGFVGEVTDDRAEKARAAFEAFKSKVLGVIEAHGGEADSATVRAAIGGGSGNLPRDLEGLISAGLIEKNGKRGAQAGYRLYR